MSSYDRKTSPSNLDAERAVLGSVLIGDNSTIAEVAGLLTPEDFYSAKNGEIWRQMLILYMEKEPIDLITLSKRGLDSVYIADLMASTPNHLRIFAYAKIVKNESRRRAAIQAAARIAASAYEEKDADRVDEIAKEVVLNTFSSIESESHQISPEKQAELIMRYLESKSKQEERGISSGFPRLDKLTGGLRRGDLIVVAARTGVGKSSYAECIAESVAKQDHPVLFFSMEMSPEQMTHRALMRDGRVPVQAVMNGPSNEEEWAAVREFAEDRSKMPLHIMNVPSATVMSVRADISQWMIRNDDKKLGLVVIDYLQLLNDLGSSDQEHLKIGEVTRSFKGMAREFDIPIIILSQLNRRIENQGGEPRNSDLRQSGRVEEDSDLILMLWQTEPDVIGNDTKMKISKNRQGATGELPIMFEKPRFLFSERPEW